MGKGVWRGVSRHSRAIEVIDSLDVAMRLRDSVPRETGGAQTVKNPAFLKTYNETTLQIVENEECLATNGDTVRYALCREEETKAKWQRALQTPVYNDTYIEQSILLQHHQYLDDKSIDNDNSIESQIHRLHCSNLKTRRLLTTLVAQES